MCEEKHAERSTAEVAELLATCGECTLLAHRGKGFRLAGRTAVHELLDELIAILFPGCHGPGAMPTAGLARFLAARLKRVARRLKQHVRSAFQYQCAFDKCKDCGDCGRKAKQAVNRLIAELPEIKRILEEDIVAAYEGDPAARSVMEVVMSYPCLLAIATHRIAHVLYREGVPLIPRIMSERAHSLTGIDIHPGATIGPGFFIDHGTGVVIGETTVIGRNVKLYQGVTLGALSFPKDEHGNPIKGIKRHPNVEDNVTIYAGATILGGETTIGAGSEIGGNVWLTHSVPPNSKVYNRQPRPLIHKHGGPTPPAAT